jgi:hypothetical protein
VALLDIVPTLYRFETIDQKAATPLPNICAASKNPETIRGTCAEYRAGASIDLEHDRADRDHKLTMPLFVLWGQRSSQGGGYDVLAVWREHTRDRLQPRHRQRHFFSRKRRRRPTARCAAFSPGRAIKRRWPNCSPV